MVRQATYSVEVIHDPELGDILVLTGDASDNDITISSSTSGSVLVEGRFGTTIDGSATSVAFTGIHSIRIELGSGDDSVLTQDLWISGSLDLVLGDGDDTLGIRGGTLGALTIDTGAGMDSVNLALATILGETEIRLGKGDDVLSVVDSVFADDFVADGGLDEDVLSLLGDNMFLAKWRRIRFEHVG